MTSFQCSSAAVVAAVLNRVDSQVAVVVADKALHLDMADK